MEDVLKRNNVTAKGKGETPILFAHGYGCDQNMWRFVTPAFEENYKIILLDQMGFGKSDVSAYTAQKYDSLQAYADDILEVANALNIKDIIFVGHSVSAIVGVLAAITAPHLFQKLILIAPSPRYINDTDYSGGFAQEDINNLLESLDSDYLAWSVAMAPVIMGNAEKPEWSEELAASFCRSNEEIARNFARLTFLSDNRADLKKLQVPSLILQCQNDVIAPLEVGNYMKQSIANSNLVILNATGHCPNLSAPEETIEAIKNFLSTEKVLY
ncbi:alpha/beta fold hydrolase [Adhaeribacter radiodurans]|uniref:Alpha/beta hydrolase n=1 Tax=Adhaeribacter radiodurans TaxID=2745197 RepID=A0A7L7L784_9BACT|nr:alpha/beta hydrolase [Adhaeribacter radiodurans]QMU28668.1 alpha/beta hydrolase [Adhaeribacter radiodurans]